jgi:hypothetical protein
MVIIRGVYASLHAAFVVWIVSVIYRGTEGDWPMCWLMCFWLDFPLSMILVGLVYGLRDLGVPHKLPWFKSPIADVNNFLLPCLFFGLAGTVWWFFLPQWIWQGIKEPLRLGTDPASLGQFRPRSHILPANIGWKRRSGCSVDHLAHDPDHRSPGSCVNPG